MRYRLIHRMATVISLAAIGAAPRAWPQTVVQSPAVGDSLVGLHLERAIADQRLLVTALDVQGVVTPIALIMAGQMAYWAGRAKVGADRELGRYIRWQTAAISDLVAGTGVAPPIPPMFQAELSFTGQLARGQCVAIHDTQSCARQLAEVILVRLQAMR